MTLNDRERSSISIHLIYIQIMTLIKIVYLLLLALLAQASYDSTLAKELAYMSSIAYENVDSISSWSCGDCSRYAVGNVNVFQDKSKDNQGYTGYSDARIIVAFRGSSNLDNWISNIEVAKVDYPKCTKCEVHDGFYKVWLTIADVVKAQVQELRILYSSAPIIVTGHSLGGALAILAAVELQEIFGKVEKVVTFGQPRVGNDAFAAYFSTLTESLRVVHYADIVPHLPWASTSYLHQGIEIWYDQQMTNYEICLFGQSDGCSNSLPFYDYGTGDHHIYLYVTLPATVFEYLGKRVTNALSSIKNWFKHEPKLSTEEK